MAAILKLRRGLTASPALVDGELFLNYTTKTVQFASGSSSPVVSNLLPLGKRITGDIDILGDITASNINLSGDITIGGNIFLGDSVADNIVVSGEFSSSLIPNDHNQYDLGSTSKKWRHLHSISASIDNITLPGSGIVSSSQQISNYNTFLEINGDSVFSQSVQIDHDSTTNFVANEHINHTSVNITAGLGISGGGDISATRTITLDTGSNHFGSGVINALTGSGIVSSSIQIANYNRFLEFNGDSVVSSSQQIADYNRFLEFNGDNVVSSSQQIADYNRFLEFNGDNVVSSSQQVIDHLHGSNIVSGSSQLTSSYDSRYLNTNSDNVVSSSQQISNYNTFLEINSDNVVSSSQQISNYNTFLEIDGDGVISQSQQVTLGDVSGFTNYSSSVDGKIESIHDYTSSLKTAISLNSDNVTILGNLTVQGTETALNTNQLIVEDKLISVASGSTTSAQADGAGLHISGANKSITWDDTNSSILIDGKVSSSVGFKGDGSELTSVTAASVAYTNITGLPTLVSGSDQVTSSLDSRYLEIDGDSVISESSQVNANSITNFDSNVVDAINDENVHSGSYLGTATTTNLTEGTNLYYTDARVLSYVNDLGVFSGSEQLPAGTVSGSSQLTSSYDSRYLNTNGEGVVSGSSQLTSSFDTRYLNTDGDGVISGSEQVTFLDISSIPSGIISGAAQLPNGTISSSAEGSAQGTVSLNGSDVNVKDLQSDDTPTFSNVNLSNVSLLGAGETNALFSGSAGSIGYRVLGTAAFFNVSASVGNDPNSIPTNAAVDAALVAAGAGDITAINNSSLYPSANTGIKHTTQGTNDGGVYGTTGNVVIEVDTGSAHFTGGVTSALPDGLVSQSLLNDLSNGEVNQLKNINTSTISSTQWGYLGALNQNLATTNNVQFNNLVVAGDLTVQGTETTLNTANLLIEDKLISVASGSVDSAAANGGGLHISGADVSMTWDNANDRFSFNTGSHFDGDVLATGDIVAYASSDERLKNNITQISGPIQKVKAINGYTFDWDEEKQNTYKGRDYGVIAQEIERVAPELVDTRQNGYKAVRYDKLVPILIESIKELSNEVEQLKKKING